MTKLLKVLALLVVILGLGISCASAADVTLSFNPQTVELQPGSSQTVQIVMNQIPANGLSGFNITVSVADPTIANFTAVSAPAWGGLIGTSTVPANSVWITAVDTTGKVHAGDTNVSFGSITITGIKGGKTNLTIVPKEIDDLPGNFIIPDVSTCQVIVLPPQPVAGFTEDVKSGVAPLKVHFTDKSQYATTVNWDFNGDGVNDKSDAPGDQDYTYTTPGTYTVKQTVINDNGTASATENISVIKPPTSVKADFKFVATNLAVQFTDNSTGSPNNWTWDFGDNTPNSIEQSPSHTYADEGNYSVKLSVKNAEGSTDSITKYVNVTSAPVPTILPVADFRANVTEGYAPLAVKFTDQSKNATHLEWNFGDNTGNTSVANPEHVFTAKGLFNVVLTASNGNGTSSKSMTINVTSAPVPTVLPVADFSANVTEGYAPLAVKFTDQSKNATHLEWNFGDNTGNTSVANPEHVFTAKGLFNVVLTASNVNGSSSKSMTINVTPTPNPNNVTLSFNPQVVSLQSGSPKNVQIVMNQVPANGLSGFNITVSVANSTITNITAVSPPSWAGVSSNSTVPSGSVWITVANLGQIHPGDTNVSLGNITITGGKEGKTNLSIVPTELDDNNGNLINPDVTMCQVTVTAPIPPSSLKINDFTADVTKGDEPLKVHFTSDVSGSPTKWTWKFERSATQSFKVGTATHTFEHYGTYDITLTVRDAAGHTDTLTKKAFITVLKVKPPRANFVGTPTSGKVPLTVKFTDMSKNNPDHWKWDFGDGKKSTLQNPSHTYTRAGKYTVTLSVRNYAGSDTKKVYHYIIVVSGHRH